MLTENSSHSTVDTRYSTTLSSKLGASFVCLSVEKSKVFDFETKCLVLQNVVRHQVRVVDSTPFRK